MGRPARLSFISERHGHRDVYVIGADGSDEQRLTMSSQDEYNGPSTPDGSQILITVGPPEQRAGERDFRFLLLPLATAGKKVSPSRAHQGPLPLLPQGRALLRQPSFLPDGKRLVFESEPDGSEPGLREIFLLSLGPAQAGRPALRQLTRNREGNFTPTVCGQSDYLAFTSSRDRASELYRMRADGSDLRRLTYCQGSKWAPRCSPDGLRIFFVSDCDGADRIYSVHRNGSEPRRLTARSLDSAITEDSPTVSSDGRKVAYVLREVNLGARLHVVDLGSGRDCDVPTPPGTRASEPDWSPRQVGSSPRLAFTLQAADAPNQPKTAARQIFIVDGDCHRIVPVTTARGPNWHPLWLN